MFGRKRNFLGVSVIKLSGYIYPWELLYYAQPMCLMYAVWSVDLNSLGGVTLVWSAHNMLSGIRTDSRKGKIFVFGIGELVIRRFRCVREMTSGYRLHVKALFANCFSLICIVLNNQIFTSRNFTLPSTMFLMKGDWILGLTSSRLFNKSSYIKNMCHDLIKSTTNLEKKINVSLKSNRVCRI